MRSTCGGATLADLSEADDALVESLNETLRSLYERLGEHPATPPALKDRPGRPRGTGIKGDATPLIRISVVLMAGRAKSFAAAVRTVPRGLAIGNSLPAFERRMRRKYENNRAWLSSVAETLLELEKLHAALPPQVFERKEIRDGLRQLAEVYGLIFVRP